MIVKVPISLFASCVGYCECIIVNHFHLGIKPKVSEAQLVGSRVHDQLEAEDKLIKRVEASDDELLNPLVDLDLERESVVVQINRGDFCYVGRVDKLVRLNGDVYIIDDKTSNHPSKAFIWPDRLAQLSAYCEGFKECFGGAINFNKLFLVVCQRGPEGQVFDQCIREYDNLLKNDLLTKMASFESVYNKESQPTPQSSINRCKACKYDCGFRLNNY
ncbi:MAG: hypothetical protein WC307_02840 [Candidatus Nanoarchaeia archaeon]